MDTYKIRAEEKYTGYQISEYNIQANSPEEAKQILLTNNRSIEPEDTYDIDSEDYTLINIDNWDITIKDTNE